MASPSTAAKCFTEFYGTCILVLVITCSVAMGSALAPVAIGLTLCAMIYAGGHISGGHYNPAVSLAIAIRMHKREDGETPFYKSKFTWGNMFMYWAAQTFGAIIGSLIGFALTGGVATPQPGVEHTSGQALIAEIVATMFLAFVVLNVATTNGLGGNQFYGLAIGICVLAYACSVGGISGGCFNPAVATGLLLTSEIGGSQGMDNIWLYWIGDLLGGLFAAILFMATNKIDYDDVVEL